MKTTAHRYKNQKFSITVTPMRELGRNKWTWAAKIGKPISTGREYYGHTAGEARKKAIATIRKRIDGRVENGQGR